MQQNPSKEKIVNSQDQQMPGAQQSSKSGKENQPPAEKAKDGLSDVNLKGKKVDGDPELPEDQPVDIINK